MKRAAENAERLEVRSRENLRHWLSKNYTDPGPVWLVFWKKHTDHYVPFVEFVEECLCWGWVDSVSRGVDADRSSVMIAPRNESSAWSAINKGIVEKARASGAMTKHGEAKIAAAKANGMWNFLDDVERLEVPEDLAEALKSSQARNVWNDFPRSIKRASLEWVKTAKTQPTRDKRITDIATSAAQNERPSPFRRK